MQRVDKYLTILIHSLQNETIEFLRNPRTHGGNRITQSSSYKKLITEISAA